jgi:site-specific DNA-methyltransferase (adenine-specific)/modification methylase
VALDALEKEVMAELMNIGNTLPSKIEDLAKFVLIGRDQLNMVRAGIKALDKLDMAKDVREQKKQEAQMLAEALMDAEVRIGEILLAMPKASGKNNQYVQEKVKILSGEEFHSDPKPEPKPIETKQEAATKLGFNKQQVERFQTLAQNKDVVEQVKQEARANDDLATRTAVLKAVREQEHIKNRFSSAIDMANNYTKVETAQQANEYIAQELSVKYGDIYLIGNRHKLIISDAYDIELIKKIFGKIDAVITDPPYGINYKSPSGSGETKRGDYNIIIDDNKDFDPSILFEYSNNVVSWGANHYANKLHNSAGWLIWDKRESDAINNNSDCELAWSNMVNSARLFHHKWNGMIKASERNEQRIHPTQKPVKLFIWTYEITQAGQFILDPFSGSGASLIACHETGRTCYLVEKDLSFAAASIMRFRMAGLEVKKI